MLSAFKACWHGEKQVKIIFCYWEAQRETSLSQSWQETSPVDKGEDLIWALGLQYPQVKEDCLF